MIFAAICLALSVLNALLWWRADRRARALPAGRWRATARVAFATFFVAMLLYPLVPLSRLLLDEEPASMPAVWATAAYLWLPVLLPLTALCWATVAIASLGFSRLRRRSAVRPIADPTLPPTGSPLTGPPAAGLSRRDALGLAAAAFPPLAAVSLTGVALSQRGEFRVRPLTLFVPTLPEDLDGLTICHLTDLHAGNFVPADMVDRVAAAANALAADLVVFTGDLIDRGLLDRLPVGMRLYDRFDRRHGLAVIEGNHDVQANAAEFEQAMRHAKLPFLLDEQVTYEVPSKRTPGKRAAVQLLGLTWGELKETSDAGSDAVRPLRVYSEEATADSVRRVAALRRPDAFPILLAHHPHAFDAAAAAGLPLTLAGHSHGGQIMLTQTIGAGPLRFRYWNGVHERNGCQMVISNGLGSWFPLRVNAPAEILHLTLRRGTPLVLS
jgi:predicted MPP superfamily phosphohydrolase